MSDENKPSPAAPPHADNAPPPPYTSYYPTLPGDGPQPTEPLLPTSPSSQLPTHEPMQPPQSNVVVMQQPQNVVVVTAPMFGRSPMHNVYCPNCKMTVDTYVELVTNCCCLCLLFWFCGIFSLLVLCYDGLKDAEHHCMRCKSVLGRCTGWDSLSSGGKAGVICVAFLLACVQSAIIYGIKIAAVPQNSGHY